MDYLEADSHVLFWMGVFFDGHGIFSEEMSEEINYYNFLLTMINLKAEISVRNKEIDVLSFLPIFSFFMF